MNALTFALPLLLGSLIATSFPVVSVQSGEFRLPEKCAGWEQKCGKNMPTTLPMDANESISFVQIRLAGDVFDHSAKIGANGVHYDLLPCDGRKYNSYNLYPFAKIEQPVPKSSAGNPDRKHTEIRIEIPSNLKFLNIEKGGHGYTWMADAIPEKNVCIQINSGNMAGYNANVEMIDISRVLKLTYK
jgi:hypothetical protein